MARESQGMGKKRGERGRGKMKKGERKDEQGREERGRGIMGDMEDIFR